MSVPFACRCSRAQYQQAMGNNRDNFHEVTNETGSLLESVVRYAREHEPTSEGFIRICNEFLR